MKDKLLDILAYTIILLVCAVLLGIMVYLAIINIGIRMVYVILFILLINFWAIDRIK